MRPLLPLLLATTAVLVAPRTAGAAESEPAPSLRGRPFVAVAGGLREVPTLRELHSMRVEVGGTVTENIELGCMLDYASSTEQEQVFAGRAGGAVRYRFRPRALVDFWIGGYTALEVLSPGRHTAVPGRSAILGYIAPSPEIGIDVRLGGTTLGAFASVDMALLRITASGLPPPAWSVNDPYSGTVGARLSQRF